MRTTRIYNYPSSADCTTATNDGLPERARIKPCRYWLSDFLVRRVLAHVRITANLVHQIQAGSTSPSTFAVHLEEYLRPLGCSEFSGGTIRLTRADGDGFLFCNRCAVRRFTLLMKRETLQSSTAPYFDGGSFRFAETRAAEPALHSRARSFSTLLFVDLDVAARYEPSITVGEIWSGYADEKRVL